MFNPPFFSRKMILMNKAQMLFLAAGVSFGSASMLAQADEPAPLPPGVQAPAVAADEIEGVAAGAVNSLVEEAAAGLFAAGVAISADESGEGFQGTVFVNDGVVESSDPEQFAAAQEALHHAVAARVVAAAEAMLESENAAGFQGVVVTDGKEYTTTRTAEFLRRQRQLHRNLAKHLRNFTAESTVFVGVIVNNGSVHLFDDHEAWQQARTAVSE